MTSKAFGNCSSILHLISQTFQKYITNTLVNSFVSKNKWHSPKLQSSPWNTSGKHLVNFLRVLQIHILLAFPSFNGGFTWLLGHKCLQNQHCRARGEKIGSCFSNYDWDSSNGVRGTCLSVLVGLFWRAWAGVYSVFYFYLVWIKKKN